MPPAGALVLPVLLALAASSAAAAAPQNVTVVRMQVALEETLTVTVDPLTEYILDFIPTDEQRLWPARVWVSTDGGDTSRPLLVTYRQRAGAGTWQLPLESGSRLQFSIDRTLCPDDSVADLPSDCVGEAEPQSGWFSLHAVSACARPLTVRLRAAPALDWAIAFQRPLDTAVTPEAPRVHHYSFLEDQEHVRLVVSSEDDVCATVAIQNYTCPIGETLTDLVSSTIRMTVQRSGAVQLSRSRFPRGFYVIVIAHETDEACAGELSEGEDWLWSAAVFGETRRHTTTLRRKLLTIDTRAALSRAQYAVAGAATVAVFLGFYLAFLLLVVAQRWPTCARYVAPKAVLADPNKAETGIQSQADSTIVSDASTRRRRRASDATFDSSDNSDSDDSEESTSYPPRPAAPAPAPASASTPVAVASSPGANSTPVAVVRQATEARVSSSANGHSVTDGIQVERVDANGQQQTATESRSAERPRPFGLPAELRVAALARRRERVIRARSDRYLHTLYTVAVFYALPVLQFVAAFQIFLNVSGSLDTCYYNFLCAHPAGQLSDFNHVFSNLGYLLLGALFMLQLRRRRQRRKRAPRDEEYGIPAHYGLLMSLGAGMMVVALLSASYHVCPNRLNFQFDTAFMYVLAVVAMVKMYQARHPDVNARAHATFAVLAVLIALVVWGVLGGGALFWGVFTVLHVFTFLLLSLRIYYLGQFRLEKASLAQAAAAARSWAAGARGAAGGGGGGGARGLRPLYSARLVLLLIANAVNWAFALYGLFKQSADFASHLLSVLLCNTLMYMVFYLVMKLLHGERPRWYAWAFLASAAAAWAPALYFFTSGSSSWAETAARSRHMNHECRVLQFYDSHDLWHMLSAVALYLSFNAMLTWDDGLSAVPRTQIAVF